MKQSRHASLLAGRVSSSTPRELLISRLREHRSKVSLKGRNVNTSSVLRSCRLDLHSASHPPHTRHACKARRHRKKRTLSPAIVNGLISHFSRTGGRTRPLNCHVTWVDQRAKHVILCHRLKLQGSNDDNETMNHHGEASRIIHGKFGKESDTTKTISVRFSSLKASPTDRRDNEKKTVD